MRNQMQRIDVVFYREGRYWVAQALNVDISSFGDTIDEARAAIDEALEFHFEDSPDHASTTRSAPRMRV